MSAPAGSVPCQGCTRCCQGDAVRLLAGDDPSQYQTEPHPYAPGELMLAHNANQGCIYVGPAGCTIYERRPRMCREQDCRLIARRFSYTEARQVRGGHGRFVAVWRQGKDKLRAWPLDPAPERTP